MEWSTNGAVYFKDAGFYVAVTTTTANPYTVDGNVITVIKKHVRNLGAISGNYTWSDSTNISIAKVNNGGTITWNYAGEMILVNSNATTYAGSSVPAVYGTAPGGFIDWGNAIIGFTGNSSGTTAAGSSYTANITSRVDYNLYNCAPYASTNAYLNGIIHQLLVV